MFCFQLFIPFSSIFVQCFFFHIYSLVVCWLTPKINLKCPSDKQFFSLCCRFCGTQITRLITLEMKDFCACGISKTKKQHQQQKVSQTISRNFRVLHFFWSVRVTGRFCFASYHLFLLNIYLLFMINFHYDYENWGKSEFYCIIASSLKFVNICSF